MKLNPLVGLTSLALALPLSAATIVDFDFSGVNGTVAHDATYQITATSTLDSNLTVVTGVSHLSPSIVSSATAGGATTNDLNLEGFNAVGGGADVFADSVARNSYISFVITADAGFALNLDGATISWDVRRNGGGAADVYGIAANSGSGLVQVGTDAVLNTSLNTVTRTLSGAEWDGLTGDVEIFLYGWGNTNPGGNTHISDAVISGAASVVAVPEPSSTALLGLGGLALIMRRRK